METVGMDDKSAIVMEQLHYVVIVSNVRVSHIKLQSAQTEIQQHRQTCNDH